MSAVLGRLRYSVANVLAIIGAGALIGALATLIVSNESLLNRLLLSASRYSSCANS
ncbi:MAG TPA: hypothetical protein VGH98_01865 [Gemmatimonadaceae bacterium]